MECKSCGTLLEAGSVYCPSCGEEVQLISEEMLDDEFFSSALQEEDKLAKDQSADPWDALDDQAEDPWEMSGYRPAPVKMPKGHNPRKRILIVCILLAALIVAAVFVVSTARNHSESYMLQQASKYYNAHDYDEASDHLNRILELNPDNEDALIMLAKICVSTKDYDQGETLALHYLELKPSSTDGYRTLLQIYTGQGRYDEILARSNEVTDPDILAVFDEFMTPMPSVNREGGDYDERLEITLTSSTRADIYYTTDGSSPTADSELFDPDEPIALDEEGDTTISAICIDAKGHQSRVMSETYTLTFPEAEPPEIDPEGGEFSEQAYIHVTVEDGATAYYDWDDEPMVGGYEYEGSIRVKEGNHVLEVIAVNEYGKVSDVVKYNFIYYPPVVEEEPEPEETTDTEEVTETETEETTSEDDSE